MKTHFSDAHIHAFHEKWKDQSFLQVLAQAREKGITTFLGAGYHPPDWVVQFSIAKQSPSFFPVIGMHPMWVHGVSEEDLEAGLSQLAKSASQALAIGEMGLDLRDNYLTSFEKQKEYFREQLELAQFIDKPVVLHIVRAHSEACAMMDLIGLPRRRGMVHAFSGGWQRMQDFHDRGIYTSLGSAITYPRNQPLREAVKMMNLDYLLLESDSPDQPPLNWPLEVNLPESIFRAAQVIGSLRGMGEEEVLLKATQNLQRLFPEICK